MSQATAAKKVGTTQRRWCDWEKEEHMPDVDFAEEIERLTSKQIRMEDWARARRAKRLAEKKPQPEAKAG